MNSRVVFNTVREKERKRGKREYWRVMCKGMGWVFLVLGNFNFWVLFYFITTSVFYVLKRVQFYLGFSGQVQKLRANYKCFKCKFCIVRGQILKFRGGWGSKYIVIEIKESSCCK